MATKAKTTKKSKTSKPRVKKSKSSGKEAGQSRAKSATFSATLTGRRRGTELAEELKKAKASKARGKKKFKSSAKVAKKTAGHVRASSRIVALAVAGLSGRGVLQTRTKSKLELRDWLGMTRQMFGRIVDVSERTIADVEAGKSAAKKLVRPYNEIYRLRKALADVVDPKCLGDWFQTPNDAFDGLKPIEVIERGEIDRLWNMVFRLQTGMPG